jgi:hypothetical protein
MTRGRPASGDLDRTYMYRLEIGDTLVRDDAIGSAQVTGLIRQGRRLLLCYRNLETGKAGEFLTWPQTNARIQPRLARARAWTGQSPTRHARLEAPGPNRWARDRPIGTPDTKSGPVDLASRCDDAAGCVGARRSLWSSTATGNVRPEGGHRDTSA